MKCDGNSADTTNLQSWGDRTQSETEYFCQHSTTPPHSSQINMELQEDNLPPAAITDKEDQVDQEDHAGANNNNLPTQVSVDELELLWMLEEANRYGW